MDPIDSYVYQSTHSYLQETTYIAYHIILSLHSLYSIPSTEILFIYYTDQQKGLKNHVTNMWIPTKRYIISSYEC